MIYPAFGVGRRLNRAEFRARPGKHAGGRAAQKPKKRRNR